MEIGPLRRVSMTSPPAADATRESLGLVRGLVAAIHTLNRPELLERGREWRLRRGAAGRRPMVDLVDRETGEVLDELPPDEVLRMLAELEERHEGEL